MSNLILPKHAEKERQKIIGDRIKELHTKFSEWQKENKVIVKAVLDLTPEKIEAKLILIPEDFLQEPLKEEKPKENKK